MPPGFSHSWKFEEKYDSMKNVKINTTMHCILHNKQCFWPHIDVDDVAWPCVDYSPSGKRKGIEGETNILFISHAKFHKHSSTPIIFGENVPQLLESFVRFLYGDDFWIYVINLGPDDVGFELLARRRQFFLMLRKGAAVLTHNLDDVMKFVCGMIIQARQTLAPRLEPCACMIANRDEIRAEEIQLTKRRRLVLKPESNLDLNYVRNKNEVRRCKQFEKLWKAKFSQPASSDPNALFHLGDNPLSYLCWSAGGRIPSYRKSMGMRATYFAKLVKHICC
jgi:hypothetical protein